MNSDIGSSGDTPFSRLALANPALRNLVARHLHPDGVDAVGRHGGYLGHHHTLATGDVDGVEHHVGQRVGQRQTARRHHEIVVLRIVMSGRKRDGVYLLLGQVPRIRRPLPMVVARHQQHRRQQHQQMVNPRHRHSSDSSYNQTQDGTAARRPAAGAKGHATRACDRHA